MVALVAVSCQAECLGVDSLSLAAGSELVASNSKPVQQVRTNPESEVSSKEETCDCANSKVEVPQTEQVVIKKVGKKYKVISITLPLEADSVEAITSATTDSDQVESTVDDEEAPKSEKSVESPGDDELTLVEEKVEPEPVETPQKELKKQKAKVEKKKYKRDVGKKSVDKKSSKRKNKEQGKKKSKK